VQQFVTFRMFEVMSKFAALDATVLGGLIRLLTRDCIAKNVFR
jgi:hypothetical protein